MKSLAGKIAIVTGAGSGIGHATARVLAGYGVSVVVADIVASRAQQVAADIRDLHGRAIAFRVDVTDEDQIKAMIAAAVNEYGRLDILHNNVGDVRPETYGRDSTVTTMDAALWDSFMHINLRSVMFGCKWAIPEMIKQGGGAIVNTSSVGSLGGEEREVAYGVSKAGINTLTQYIATAHGKQRIRCNAIAPGFTLTPAAQRLAEPVKALFLRNVLTPYLGEADDIAQVVAFLASSEARYITGQTIVVDGGENAHQVTYSDLRRMRGE
jgi:NAD(P)-dependent dehydrogenase (short-subunit alcohol dehydrogenase family)